VDERNVVITDKVAGNVSQTEEIALSADLKTLTMTLRDTTTMSRTARSPARRRTKRAA
jgi:hypothetical protein